MSTRSYKRGVADTIHAFEEYVNKQANATNFVGKEVQDIQQHINDLYEHITEQEKNALYKFSTPFDIRQLDEHDKLLIVGILYALASDKYPTENQKLYIQLLQKYIEVRECPIGIYISVIENIDSITTQKIIFQIVIEYLALQDSDAYDETDMQTDLLNSFSISTKVKNEIIERVEFVYKILGNEGISKKYDVIDVNADKKELFFNEKEKVIASVKKLQLEALVLPVPRQLYSNVNMEEFSTKSQCLTVAKSEVKRIYNSARELFDPNSNKSIVATAFDRLGLLLKSIEEVRHSVSMFPAEIFESKDIIDELIQIVDIDDFKRELEVILKEELQKLSVYDTFASLDSYISKIKITSFSDGGIMGALTATWTCWLPWYEISEEANHLIDSYAVSACRSINKKIDNMAHKIEETLNKIQIV